MKIGLVIQGPIIGGGLTGATYGEGKTNAPVSKFNPFNALDTIQDNVTRGVEYFDQIVLSTWKGEPTDALREHFSDDLNFQIIENDDPTPNPNQKRKLVPGIPYLHQANKVRMFHSTRKGLETLQKSGVTHAVKIRTDQSLNLKLLHEEVSTFLLQAEGKLFIPSLRENTPWIVSDFYFGGQVSLLESICKFLENSPSEFHDNPHTDFFFKTYFLMNGMFEATEWGSYFIDTNTDPVSPSTDAVVRSAIEKIWSPGSRRLYESILWRGEKIKFIQSDSYFSDSKKPFKFNYQVSHKNRNMDYGRVAHIFFGKMRVTSLISNSIYIRLRKSIRKTRNQISRFRDKYGLRL
jgi:hypothetical protein